MEADILDGAVECAKNEPNTVENVEKQPEAQAEAEDVQISWNNSNQEPDQNGGCQQNGDKNEAPAQEQLILESANNSLIECSN